jgi:hypothetical protein
MQLLRKSNFLETQRLWISAGKFFEEVIKVGWVFKSNGGEIISSASTTSQFLFIDFHYLEYLTNTT